MFHLLLLAFALGALALPHLTVGGTTGTCAVTTPAEVKDFSTQMPYCYSKGVRHSSGTKLCAADLKTVDDSLKAAESTIIDAFNEQFETFVEFPFPSHKCLLPTRSTCTKASSTECENVVMAVACLGGAREVDKDNKVLQVCPHSEFTGPQDLFQVCYADAKKWFIDTCGCPESAITDDPAIAGKDDTVCSHSPATMAILSRWVVLAFLACLALLL